MLTANKEILASIFQQNVQFIVPFFQRSYVWEKENWEILWEHLDLLLNNNGNSNIEHFIGTIILKQRRADLLGQNSYELIDGQQRLTTFSLLFKAMSNSSKGELPALKQLLDALVKYKDVYDTCFIKIKNNKNDIEKFNEIINSDTPNDFPVTHKIYRAYNYFLGKVRGLNDETLNKLMLIILRRVPIISMLLAENDDEQEIFDTINSLGVRLTTGELLKNYIFMEESLRPDYNLLWESVFEDSEEQVKFWNKEKTSGRIIRTNIEVLLYCYLIIKTRKEIRLEKLFSEYKEWLTGKTDVEKKSFLNELKNYAAIYIDFPEGADLNEISFIEAEKKFFHVIENLEITTVYPLILFGYKNISNNSERLKFLQILESYLVRRNVCRLTTKNYNNLFIQIIAKIIVRTTECPLTGDILKQILLEFTEETNKYPTDAEFSLAFHEESITNKNANEILYCISLFYLNDPFNDVHKLSSHSFTVEHILPRKWMKNWNTPALSDDEKTFRDKKLKTLGNLTLVKGNFNSSLSNLSWANKKPELRRHSSLQITTEYLDYEEWNEDNIMTRATELSVAALSIWS